MPHLHRTKAEALICPLCDYGTISRDSHFFSLHLVNAHGLDRRGWTRAQMRANYSSRVPPFESLFRCAEPDGFYTCVWRRSMQRHITDIHAGLGEPETQYEAFYRRVQPEWAIGPERPSQNLGGHPAQSRNTQQNRVRGPRTKSPTE